MSIYGYIRVSTKQQKVQRQIDNIKDFDNDAILYIEKQSGKDIEGRNEFQKLLKRVKSGDTIIFDEVSRMSRNASEGYALYMELFHKNVNLIFLKERHIDTEEYKRRTQSHLHRIESQDAKMDNLVNGILELVEEFEKENLKDNIRLAFEQAEHERLFLIKRVREGKARSQTKQGRPAGSPNLSKEKANAIKKKIRELSKDFDGFYTDTKIFRDYLQISKTTYYRYKRELLAERN
ncbi:recombinase family protein [Roseburia hominis]